MTRRSRKELAAEEIGQTTFMPGVLPTFFAAFLLTIASVGIVQIVAEWPSRPQPLDVVALLPTFEEIRSARSPSDFLALLPSLKEIDEYETALEDRSVVGSWLLPHVQTALTGVFGVGNEKAYVGRRGWLFYRSDVDYLIGPGFLEPRQLERRRLGGDAWEPPPQPDPIEAIRRFHEQLAARGIALVLVPTPVKPAVAPDAFSRRYDGFERVLQNPSYQAFLDTLEREGIRIFDPTEAIRASREPRYLRTDTHWTPETMERVAEALAAYLRAEFPALGGGDLAYRREVVAVRNLGDIALMLKLPEDQTLFPSEEVTVHPVRMPSGEPWRSSRDAAILFLGDSFSNIYSLGGMNWGEAAGFVEQLSFRLGLPIDKIVMNAGGAYATRQRLRRDLLRGDDRLAGKRVVVYQFAVRELTSGDWKLLDLPEPSETPVAAESGDTSRRAVGTIRAIATPPKPGSVPYRDAVIAIHLTDVEPLDGEPIENEILVFTWGMRENRWTEAATFTPGERRTFRLTPWEQVEGVYGSYNRKELDDEATFFLTPYWGEIER